jgi:3-oxoacyl-[acyl-carrier-protein] synthase III
MSSIVAVGTSVHNLCITNERVIALTLEYSARCYRGDIAELETGIRAFLKGAGASRRRWRSARTKPLEHIADAWDNCFARAGRQQQCKLGALIYCGIDKGVVEPSHASLLARKFGLASVRTLDVSDACMGWFTARQVAPHLAAEGRSYAAIVSAEFPIEMPGKVFPEAFCIKDDEDFSWKGAALTLGECAAVTLIDTAAPDPGGHVFKANNEFADICCVPLERADRFVDSPELVGRLSDNCFVAHMGKMAAAGYRDARDVLRRYVAQYGAPDLVLPHTVSQTMPEHISRNILAAGVLRNCFEDFGNIATCSIPAGYEHYDCGRAQGLHIAGWVAAAGMSHCVFRLL